jgi:hypothetical protein
MVLSHWQPCLPCLQVALKRKGEAAEQRQQQQQKKGGQQKRGREEDGGGELAFNKLDFGSGQACLLMQQRDTFYCMTHQARFA